MSSHISTVSKMLQICQTKKPTHYAGFWKRVNGGINNGNDEVSGRPLLFPALVELPTTHRLQW